MKPKTKEFADKLLSDPKISATQAYLDTHKTESRPSARASASELLAKPNVQIYLKKHINRAKNRVVQLVDSDKEDIALRASDSILDRALGKATQRVESTSTSVNLNLSLKDLTDTQQG